MAPMILAVWGVMRILSPENADLDIPGPPPGEVQVEGHAPAQYQAQGQRLPRQAAPVTARGLDRSLPNRIVIPTVSIDAFVEEIGLTSGGALETPSFARSDNAAWYKYGPTPGEVGPAVIVGHVDNANAPAVFFNLRKVAVGAKIEVSRADGSKVRFKVDSIEQFPKTKFPTQRVYGRTPAPTLRVVTCGGRFDKAKQDYVDNIIVFASLIG
jgi:hypothetical protein